MDIKNKHSLATKVRQNLLLVIIEFIIPFVIYKKLFFWMSESDINQLLGIGAILLAMYVFYIGYSLLFPDYEDDLPEL